MAYKLVNLIEIHKKYNSQNRIRGICPGFYFYNKTVILNSKNINDIIIVSNITRYQTYDR